MARNAECDLIQPKLILPKLFRPKVDSVKLYRPNLAELKIFQKSLLKSKFGRISLENKDQTFSDKLQNNTKILLNNCNIIL